MKQQFFQQEILLVTGTMFKGNTLYTSNGKKISAKEYKNELIKASMKGLLHKMLEGIVEGTSSLKSIYPWQLKQHADILEIELGVYPLPVEEKFSIHTDMFLSRIEYN